MNYGMHLAASGALASLHRQDLIAGNLANMNTTGFKPDRVYTQQRPPERLESPFGTGAFAEPKWLLEQLGGGLLLAPTRIDNTQGTLLESNNPLDLALEGDGYFLVGLNGRTDPDNLRLTRDGRFTLNSHGELVTVSGGHRVLDENRRTIRLDPESLVRIADDGAIEQNGAIIARLGRSSPSTDEALIKTGGNLLRVREGERITVTQLPGRIRQGFTEASAVDPILTLNEMMNATKAANSGLKMMQYHDHLLGQAFSTFGRVA